MRDLTRLLGGWTEARIDEMAAWVLEHELWPERREVVIAELAAARDEGARLILASGTYQPVLRAFAERIGAEALGTELAYLDGRATGRFAGTMGTGEEKAARLAATLGGATLDAAYGDSAADIAMPELAPGAGPGARRPRARLAHPRRACGGIPARSDMNATRAASPVIRTENLGRRFGDLWAIRGVDLELRGGEVFGLLGPNGAGKTTTVRVLSALIAPSEGRAWVDGFDVREQPDEVRRRIGILTETPGLYERLTARQNLEFFARLPGLDATTRAERIARFLRLFDLWDRRDDPAGTFSKGMKQKLAITRALLHEPSVVFLDEPTAALDPQAAFVVEEAIASLRGAGRTIVLCTPNLDEAERPGDPIGFGRGALLRVDSPERLRNGSSGPTVRIELGAPATEDQLAALRAAPGGGEIPAGGGRPAGPG